MFKRLALISGWGLIFIQIILLFAEGLAVPQFSADSWVYFSLAKNFFGNFYLMPEVRQFEFFSVYGTSFPPLYPFLIAIFTTLFPFGIYSGVMLNFAFLFLSLLVWLRLSRLLTRSTFPVIFLSLILLSNTDYVSELLAARSMVLAILLTSILILIFMQKNLQKRQVLLLGAIAGLLVLNRFDFLLPALLLGPLLFRKSRLPWSKVLTYYYAPFFLFLSPWVVYSWSHFGRIFVSDNSRTILTAFKTATMDYFPNVDHLPTLFTQPLRWFFYRFLYTGGLSLMAFANWLYQNIFIQQLIGISLLLLFSWGIIRTHFFSFKKKWLKNAYFSSLLRLTPIFLVQLMAISLTGFLDMRYALTMLFYLSLVLIVLVFSFLPRLLKPHDLEWLVILFVGWNIYGVLIQPMPQRIQTLVKQQIRFHSELLELNPFYQQISQIVQSGQSTPIILVDSASRDSFNTSQFAALSQIKTIVTPSNMNQYLLLKVLADYQVGYVYTNCPFWLKTIQQQYHLETTQIANLYRVIFLSEKSPKFPYSIQPDENYRSCGEVQI